MDLKKEAQRQEVEGGRLERELRELLNKHLLKEQLLKEHILNKHILNKHILKEHSGWKVSEDQDGHKGS